MTWIPIAETITATANQKYLIDTTLGEFSIVLPEFPDIGNFVIVADGGDVSLNNLSVISRQEFPFDTGGIFFIMDVKRSQFEFIFNGFKWVVYNQSRQGTKVSQLPEQPISQISNDDLIPFVNKVGNTYETTAIQFVNLKQRITEDVITSAEDIIAALNGSTSNITLNVKTFDGQSSDYYLNYNNLTNRPVIKTELSQFNNDLRFISNLTAFTSDNLTQGQTNKYLTEPNFTALFTPAFASSYRAFSGDLPEQSIRNSVDNIPASPITISSSTNVINITNTADINIFFPGKTIRIYGGSINPVFDVLVPPIGAATKRGFTGVVGGNTVRYKIIQFNFISGEYSPTSSESNPIDGIDFQLFNEINNVSLTFSRTSVEYGVLVYRAVGGASFILIDVLGQRQLGSAVQNIEYVDYGNFNFVPWSRKNVNGGNVYDVNTGVIHFPTSISTIGAPSRGWVDATISAVDIPARRITINAALYLNAAIIISEDDTPQVQNAINERKNLGVNALTLNDRRYIVSKLDVPSNFSIFGRGQATTIRKIPWDFNQTNKIITPTAATSTNIVLSNFTIDGNMQNQWLKAETGDPYANYAVDLKAEGLGNTIDRLRISNIVGGGIASSKASKLLIDRSRIEDSGMADLYEYSPLIVDDGLEVVITNNIFQNFTSAIDISLSDNGVFTSNIVANVGSGVIIYGSKFLISAPNIIRGPAGEYIPGPDVINSIYDSVNINLNPGTDFTSDVHKYQENGINFDISANRATLNFRMDKLRLVTNVEELYGEVLMGISPTQTKPIQRTIDITLDPVQGEFSYGISAADVNTIKSDFSISTLRAIEPNHIGLVYSAELTEYVPSGRIIAASTSLTDLSITNPNDYKVTVVNFTNLRLGRRVRMLNHGGTPSLDTLVGTITSINTPNAFPAEANLTITYDEPITVAGGILGAVNQNQITVENTFILVKGRVL